MSQFHLLRGYTEGETLGAGAALRESVLLRGRHAVVGDLFVVDEAVKNVSAGYMLDKDVEATVDGLPTDVFPAGQITGMLACRAAMVSSGNAHLLCFGEWSSEPALYLRTRFTWTETPSSTLKGGENQLLASYRFSPGDLEAAEDHFSSLNALYDARTLLINGRDIGELDAEEDELLDNLYDVTIAFQEEAPYLDLRYNSFGGNDRRPLRSGIQEVYNDTDIEQRYYGASHTILQALQDAYPQACMLSASYNGALGSTELPTLAKYLCAY